MWDKREQEILDSISEIVTSETGQDLLCELSEIISKKNKKIKELEKKIIDYRWELYPDRMGR